MTVNGNTAVNRHTVSIQKRTALPVAGSVGGPAGDLWTAFIANNSTNAVLMCSSPDGTAWTTNIDISQSSKFGPSLAYFNGRLYVAFIANNGGDAVLVCSTSDGQTWTGNTNIQQSSKFAPSLAVFNGRLYVAFIANNSGNAVLVCSTADGMSWTNNIDINQSSKFAPSLAVFNGRLYVAFIANNSGNAVLVCSSADGRSWTNNIDINQSSKNGPTLAALGGVLYVAFIANNAGDAVLVCSSTDGVHWSNNVNINQSSPFAPALSPAPIGERVQRYLNLVEQQQDQTEWCWAATTVSITKFYDPSASWTQCSLVNQAFGQTTCCQNGSTAACNQAWYPDKALTITGHLASSAAGKPPLQTVTDQVRGGRPISIAIYWTGGGGHNPAIDGCDDTDPTNPTIDVKDPWYGTSTQDFNTFPGSYNGGATWGESYFTK